ncbi:phosphatase PAP2 family protein [Metabacillus arenae]|uniref:Phosphatase PAP2 family protein n=1 Tax=Metabacillus arenae TaxID=2771434 RepID=A0A926N7Y3_9BACI|nr:phosphatase PAP2 family protein [Metabacillus arenae]MBD1379042.1 phosphatase PAP2 family protein [Metabacillus arenae]
MYIFIFLILIFLMIAYGYDHSMVMKWDDQIILFFEEVRTPFLTNFFTIMTEIGSIKFTLPFLLLIILFFMWKRYFFESLFLILGYVGVRQFNFLLKELYERDRPDFDSLIGAAHYSFPSGHAMNSAAIFTLITFFVFQKWSVSKPVIISSSILIALFILSIGLSRVYLGVHYLTDITAGFCSGIVWFFMIKFVYLWFYKNFRQNY